MLKVAVLAGVIGAVALAGQAMAAPMDDALAAFQRKDYAQALSIWRPLAEQGNAHAQANLASLFEHGWGVPRDDAQAMAWYRKSAEQGYVHGESGLAELYANGKGVPRDYGQALNWYMLAANQDDAQSEFDVGLMNEMGQGMARDVPTAIWWYRQAAAHGSADAKVRIRHWFGDKEKALNAALAAAEQGDGAAKYRLSQLYDGEFDYDNACLWLRKAAEAGSAEAQWALGRSYRYGRRDCHIEKDTAAAAVWIRKAAAQGSEIAQLELGRMYRSAEGLPYDITQAYLWLTLAGADRPPDAGDRPPSARVAQLWAAARARSLQALHTERDALAVGMTPAELAEGQRLVSDWRPR